MHLKINRINPGPLNHMVKKLLLMDSAIYLNISNRRLFSNSYTPAKDVAKITDLNISEVFEFENQDIPEIKISFFSGQKLIECLKYFDPHQIKGILHYYLDGDDYYAEKLIISDHSLKITIYCADPSLGFTTMSNEQIKAAFGTDSEIYNFTLSAENLQKVRSLITLDKNELFKIYSDSDGVHIAGDNYDIIVDEDITSKNIEVSLFKSFFNRIDRESYKIHVCNNKLIMDSEDSSTKIALNLAIT